MEFLSEILRQFSLVARQNRQKHTKVEVNLLRKRLMALEGVVHFIGGMLDNQQGKTLTFPSDIPHHNVNDHGHIVPDDTSTPRAGPLMISALLPDIPWDSMAVMGLQSVLKSLAMLTSLKNVFAHNPSEGPQGFFPSPAEYTIGFGGY